MINIHPKKPWTNEQIIEYVRDYSGKKIGVLTGGGDAPGLNAVLQGILDKAEELGYLVVAFQNGYWGIVQDPPILTDALWHTLLDLTAMGGTRIGSSRVNPAKVLFDKEERIIEKKDFADRTEDRQEYIKRNINFLGLEGLIGIGGDNTLTAAFALASEKGYPLVGIPKSIDDDYGYVYAIGRHSAVQEGAASIDRLRTTANSHGRDIVAEIMGRKSGRITMGVGVATHADIILVPEFEYETTKVLEKCAENRRNGQRYNVIVVAEGTVGKGEEEAFASAQVDGFGERIHGGKGAEVEHMLANFYRHEGLGDDIARSHKVGHLHRSGTPTSVDRIRGYKYGLGSMQLVHEKQWGKLFGYREGHYVVEPLSTAGIKKRVTDKEYDPERLNARLVGDTQSFSS